MVKPKPDQLKQLLCLCKATVTKMSTALLAIRSNSSSYALGLTRYMQDRILTAFLRWLRHLNEYGVCLLTDVPTELGYIKKVIIAMLSVRVPSRKKFGGGRNI